MTQPKLFDRTTDAAWRLLLRWRRIILVAATLWAAALSLSMLAGGSRGLAALTALLTKSAAPGLGRLVWAATVLLFGAAMLTQLADWLPGWRPIPLDWVTWHKGQTPSARRALSQLESSDAPARLCVTPADKRLPRIGQTRHAVLSTPPTWLAALETAISTGLLLTLAAAGIIAMRGWASVPIDLVVGQHRIVPARDGQCAVTLQEVRIEPQPDGPARIDAALSVEVADGSAHAVRLAQGGHAMVQGVRVTWVDDGPAFRLSAHDAEGQPIPLSRLYADQEGDMLRIAFDDAQQEKWVALTDQSLLVRMALVGDRREPYLSAQLVAGSSGDVLASADVREGTDISHERVTVSIAPEAYIRVALADASHRASAWLALGLLAVGIAALVAELVVGRETVWLEFEPQSADAVQAPVDPNVTMDGRYPLVRWRAGGSATQGEPGWLEDIAARLQGQEPTR